MARYARVSQGVVAEIINTPNGSSIADMFHPSIVAACFITPNDEVQAGWSFDGEDFAAPEPVVAPVVIPAITARQLRLWLLSQSVALADVDAAIAALPAEQREPARVEWEYSTEYERGHPLIESIGDALGFTDEEIDAGFIEAAAL